MRDGVGAYKDNLQEPYKITLQYFTRHTVSYSIDRGKTMLQFIHVQPVSIANDKPNKVHTMTDNVKFILGLAYIVGFVTLGLVLIAAYFDVLVK